MRCESGVRGRVFEGGWGLRGGAGGAGGEVCEGEVG